MMTPAPLAAADGEQLDELLQRSRRVDWRFLLPDPRLGRVIYVGPPDDPLREALADFAESVTDSETLAGESADRFDAAVLRTPPLAALARAHSLLVPGGTLYVELQRRVGREAPWLLRRYAAAAERAGFEQIEIFLNWPDFTRTTKIMPLDSGTGLGSMLVNNRQGPLAWLVFSAARLGVRLGVAEWFAPCLSLIARRETP